MIMRKGREEMKKKRGNEQEIRQEGEWEERMYRNKEKRKRIKKRKDVKGREK